MKQASWIHNVSVKDYIHTIKWGRKMYTINFISCLRDNLYSALFRFYSVTGLTCRHAKPRQLKHADQELVHTVWYLNMWHLKPDAHVAKHSNHIDSYGCICAAICAQPWVEKLRTSTRYCAIWPTQLHFSSSSPPTLLLSPSSFPWHAWNTREEIHPRPTCIHWNICRAPYQKPHWINSILGYCKYL